MKHQIEKKGTINLERLIYRRQFLLGPSCFLPNEHWSDIQLLQGLYLSIHKDLPFRSLSQGNISLTLIGIAIDASRPQYDETLILQHLFDSASEIDTLINCTKTIVGRWALILQNLRGTFLFSDPCGFRQIYYYFDGENVWCASQPELIRAIHNMPLSTDASLLQFYMDPAHTSQESSVVGSKTLYQNCLHLLPNHYLRLDALEPIRFYPIGPIKKKDRHEIVESSCRILSSVIIALAKRYDISLALTAGWDSRVLLAASRSVSRHISYFVYMPKLAGERHPDVWVPKEMAKKLGIKFDVKRAGNELPGWFISILSQSVTCARVLPKTHHIYHKLTSGENRINVNGNGSEICRNFFDKYCDYHVGDIDAGLLASRMFARKVLPDFVNQEINAWKRSFDPDTLDNINLLDFLYWEQRMGNWGGQFPAEQDIAVEEISPFNCRLLIESLLSSSRHLRSAPDYIIYQDMIGKMWPEALSFPINPPLENDFIGNIKSKIRPKIPKIMVPVIKRLLNK